MKKAAGIYLWLLHAYIIPIYTYVLIYTCMYTIYTTILLEDLLSYVYLILKIK